MSKERYSVVGCSNCDNVWIVDGHPERTSCTMCNEQFKWKQLKKLFTTNDKEQAREARALKQAEVNGVDHIYESMLEKGMFDEDVEDAIADDEYLEQKGIDPEEVKEAGGGQASGGNQSDKEHVKDAIRKLDSPDDDDVVDYVEEYGVNRDKAYDLIDRLCRQGEAMRKRGGELRLL